MPNAIVNGGTVSFIPVLSHGEGNLANATTVQDEALKNLMMSWYYAGYYTGLYEGQQQASQPRPN